MKSVFLVFDFSSYLTEKDVVSETRVFFTIEEAEDFVEAQIGIWETTEDEYVISEKKIEVE
jgi:hypothetical protein